MAMSILFLGSGVLWLWWSAVKEPEPVAWRHTPPNPVPIWFLILCRKEPNKGTFWIQSHQQPLGLLQGQLQQLSGNHRNFSP